MAVTQKPRSRPVGGFKKNESQESAQAGRERKREAKRKGLKAGNRQAVADATTKGKGDKVARDPRIGSRKPVALVVEAVAKPAAVRPQAPKAAPVSDEQRRLQALEREMEAIENDERLNLLLDRLDDGETLAASDQQWLDEQLARHQVLAAELGIENDDEESMKSSPDDLLQRFIDDDFDPRELDPGKAR